MKMRHNYGTAAYPKYGYAVFDTKTERQVGSAFKSLLSAKAAADKKDLEYGGYRFTVIELGETPDKDRRVF